VAAVEDSEGERQLASYLDDLGIPWEREALVGGKRPDYLVAYEPHPVALEVYEPEIRLPRGTVFHFDSAPHLRQVYEGRKQEQAQAAKNAGVRFAFVFGETQSEMPLGPVTMAAAMFGQVAVQFPIWLGEGAAPLGAPESKTVFGRGARLQPGQNTSVSAVAILRIFNPTLRRLQELYLPRLEGLDNADAVLDVIIAAEEEAIAAGIFEAEARRARLIVLHNPYAHLPIEVGTFTGPYDEEWGLQDEGYTRIAAGPLHHELPV
jgi:hypothetical protein